MEKCVNCWKPLRAGRATAGLVRVNAKAEKRPDWAISSQASEESDEGSTTRAWSPDRTVKPHERAPRKGRYSLFCLERGRTCINSKSITKRPYSGKLDNLSAHPVKEIINKVLKNDALKFFDNLAYAEFDATKLLVVSTATDATTFYTNGTCTATNTYGLTVNSFCDMIDWMKERDIPPYSGDDYMAIAHPTTLRDLKTSLRAVYQYTVPGYTRIVNGEVGRFESCRFVEQTHIAKEAWSGGYSNQMHVFGADTVAEAIAVPEEMRGGSCPAVQ